MSFHYIGVTEYYIAAYTNPTNTLPGLHLFAIIYQNDNKFITYKFNTCSYQFLNYLQCNMIPQLTLTVKADTKKVIPTVAEKIDRMVSVFNLLSLESVSILLLV